MSSVSDVISGRDTFAIASWMKRFISCFVYCSCGRHIDWKPHVHWDTALSYGWRRTANDRRREGSMPFHVLRLPEFMTTCACGVWPG